MRSEIRASIESYWVRGERKGRVQEGMRRASSTADRLSSAFGRDVTVKTNDYHECAILAFDRPPPGPWAPRATAPKLLDLMSVYLSWVGPFAYVEWGHPTADARGRPYCIARSWPPEGMQEAHDRILASLPEGFTVLVEEDIKEPVPWVEVPVGFLRSTGPVPTVGALIFTELW